MRCARSTRPLAWGVLAQTISMLRAASARPNCVMPVPVAASDAPDPKDAGLVAVERDGLAVVLEIRACRGEVVERGFRGHDAQLQQAARGVVHVDEQRARRAAVFEPRMLAPVDLDELAETRPPMPRLIGSAVPLCAGNPEPRVDHPPPQRLPRQGNAVLLDELLARQRRTKIGVATSHKLHRLLAQGLGQLPVTRSSSLARHQPRRSVPSKGPAQSFDVAQAQP